MQHRLDRHQLLTVPNALSLFRILLIPAILWLYCSARSRTAAVLLLVLSGITDIADGKIARRFNMVSDVGKILDPVADKLTQGAALVCLASRYRAMWVLIVFFLVREGLLAILGGLTLKYTNTVNSARWFGKACTVLLYAVILLLFLFPSLPKKAVRLLIGLCCAAIVLSGALYVRFYRGLLAGKHPGMPGEKTALRIWRGVVACVWTAVVLLCVFHRDAFTVESIVSHSPSSPAAAVLVMLLLFALKSLSLVIYCGVLYAASGLLFPLPAALAVNLCGTAIMVSLPYWIGKKTGSEAVCRITAKYPRAAHLRTLRTKNDFVFTMLVRYIGILPGDLVSLYMGAAGLRYSRYLPGCLAGMLPTIVLFSLMGSRITSPGSPLFIVSVLSELAVMVSSYLLYRSHRKRAEAADDTAAQTK